jgi:release factor glutamine methyltransferase
VIEQKGVRLESDTGEKNRVSDLSRTPSPPPTLGEVLRRSTDHLAEKGSSSPRVDAERLLAHALDVTRIELYTQLDRPLGANELAAARELVARRAAREPLQYILGEWGFRRLTLTVDRRALIPRPETELVVERCLALLEGAEAPRVLDVGTGSGAIALAIADEHPGARVTGVDASDDALELARENVDRTGLPVELQRHDLFAGLPDGPWALVVSNPPYVDPHDRDALQPEVRDWEPAEALFGRGASAAVAAAALPVLDHGGALVLEVGDGQAASTADMLTSLGYVDVRVTPDLARRDRVVEGRR